MSKKTMSLVAWLLGCLWMVAGTIEMIKGNDNAMLCIIAGLMWCIISELEEAK